MFQPKLGIFALTLEAAAWSGIALGERSDTALLVYLLSHAGASMILALCAIAFVPKRLRHPKLPILLLLFGTSFAIPILGIIGIVFGIMQLNTITSRKRNNTFEAVVMPEVDIHQRAGSGFRQAGMRAFISNARAPVATRMRALVALQNVSGRVASPLLRGVLSDPSEDIRLLAYGMLDSKEKILNDAIHQESQHFRAAAEGSDKQTESARKMADLYWELVYQELAQGDLRTHALQQSLHYISLSLARTPEDASLHLRVGRLLQSMGKPEEAGAAYDRALALGMPKTRIIPYLAEVAYELGRFEEVHALMRELGDWQSLPRLKPVIGYWSKA